MQITVVFPWTDRERGRPLYDVRAASQCLPGDPMVVRLHPNDLFSALLTDEVIRYLRRRPHDPNEDHSAAGVFSSLTRLPVVVDRRMSPGRVLVGPNGVLVDVRR